jgi:hypothetical protein
MKATGETFNISLRGETILIEVYKPKTKGGKLFLAKCTNESPLFVTLTSNDGEEFWTSIPEGRLELAKEIGKLIERHYHSSQQQSLF